MMDDTDPDMIEPTSHEILGIRYSLKEMLEEVAVERRESVFGRELVDATEIEKMFSKNLKKKRKR